MGIETVIMAVIYVAAAAVAYTGYQRAKKMAQSAAAKNRGLVYQTRAAAFPRRIVYGRRRVGGLECYVTSSGAKNEYIHYVFIWADGPCQQVEKILFDGETAWSNGAASSRYSGFIFCESRLGGEDNEYPITGGEIRIEADPPDRSYYSEQRAGRLLYIKELGEYRDVMASSIPPIPGWGSDDHLYGICYSVVSLKYDEDVFPNGVPDISAIIVGRNDIYDPRIEFETGNSGITGHSGTVTSGFAGYAWTDNAVLCMAHYLTFGRKGPQLDYIDAFDIESLIDAANVCDEAVPFSSGGYEKRYTFNGVISLEDDAEAIIEEFRTAMAGAAVRSGQKWRFYAGAYISPSFVINKNVITGPVRVQNKTSKRNLVNTVKGTYISERRSWQPTDFPAYVDTAALAEDGEELLDDIDLSNCNSSTRARRLAKINIKRARFCRQVSLECNIEALRAQPGLPVLFDLPEIGYSMVPMLVIEFGMNIADNVCTINLTLRETSPDIFDWDPEAEDEVDFEHQYPSASRPDFPPGYKPSDPFEYPDFYPELVWPSGVTWGAYGKERSGLASLIGHSEFLTPSIPPKKYLVKTWSGTIEFIRTVWNGSDCSNRAGVNNRSTSAQSGSCEYNAVTGAVTNTGTLTTTIIVGPGSSGTSVINCGTNNNHTIPTLPVEIKTNTEDTISGFVCSVDASWTDSYDGNQSAKLTSEDTDENAINRLQNTLTAWDDIPWVGCTSGICASAHWEDRDLSGSTSFNIAFKEGKMRIQGSGFGLITWQYTLKVELWRKLYHTSDPYTLVGTLEFPVNVEQGGSLDTTIDVPNTKGYSSYLTSPVLEI